VARSDTEIGVVCTDPEVGVASSNVVVLVLVPKSLTVGVCPAPAPPPCWIELERM